MRIGLSHAIPALSVLSLTAASIQSAKPAEVGFSPERLKRVHETIQRYIDAHEISGAVTLVARKGRIAHFEAQGLMDIDSKKPMPKDGLFWIASMSKPVTAVAILMLLEEGKLRLNDPVSKFIPELAAMKVAVIQEAPAGPGAAVGGRAGVAPKFYTIPVAREITIQDLLTHVSGLVSGGDASTAALARIDHKKGETLADFIPRLGMTPLDFQPGSRWSYSPTAGFDTLARIVEVISGQTFDRFLRERIFTPLGMKDTSFRPSDGQMPRFATIYERSGAGMTKAKDDGWLNDVAPTFFPEGAG
jgi:CubicO group peptidase (beta-lactamase class C family)